MQTSKTNGMNGNTPHAVTKNTVEPQNVRDLNLKKQCAESATSIRIDMNIEQMQFPSGCSRQLLSD